MNFYNFPISVLSNSMLTKNVNKMRCHLIIGRKVIALQFFIQAKSDTSFCAQFLLMRNNYKLGWTFFPLKTKITAVRSKGSSTVTCYMGYLGPYKSNYCNWIHTLSKIDNLATSLKQTLIII